MDPSLLFWIGLILVCLDLASCVWPEPPPRCPEIAEAVLGEEGNGSYALVEVGARNYTAGQPITVTVRQLGPRDPSWQAHMLLTAVLVDIPHLLHGAEPATPEAMVRDNNTIVGRWQGDGKVTRCVRPEDTLWVETREAEVAAEWVPTGLAGLAGGVVFVANIMVDKHEMMIKSLRVDSPVIKGYSEPPPSADVDMTSVDHVTTPEPSTATTTAAWYSNMSAESWFYLCTIVASYVGMYFTFSLLLVS